MTKTKVERQPITKSLIKKLKKVVKETGSYRAAADFLGIPKSTIHDIISGKYRTSRYVDDLQDL